MTKFETNEQGETVAIVDTKPVYCTVRIDMLNERECVIEGWLLVADVGIEPFIQIQPSVEYDPENAALAFPISQLLSVIPASPRGEVVYAVAESLLDDIEHLSEAFNDET